MNARNCRNRTPRAAGASRRPINRARAVVFGLAFAQVPVGAARAEGPTRPTLQYWHIWTDDAGVSHQTRCELHNFDLRSMNPPADPQWQDNLKGDGANVILTVQPVGWVGTWHEDPKPQWIIPLSGRWFVETMDGTRTEMGPGDVSFGEDQNTRPNAQGHKGHLSGTVGNEPCVLMVVQLKDKPTINQPGHFK